MFGLRTFLLIALAALVVGLPFQIAQWLDAQTAASISRKIGEKSSAQPKLRVGVMIHPTVYYEDPNGERAGLEHDLVYAFATTRKSGVDWKTFADPESARRALFKGELDIVALGASNLGLSATELATKTKYHESGWALLHTPNKFQPKSLAELLPKRVVVSSRIFSNPRFDELKRKNPSIVFSVDTKNDDEALIAAVGDDEVPYAIVEDDTFNASRHFHYDTQRAFSVQPAIARAWLFSVNSPLLREDADQFLQRLVREGQMPRVLDRYFGFPQSRRAADFEIFTDRVGSVLPRYRRWFQEAQERYGIEWRLLAALAYQESHWNADATSETGVRGIMQFTEDTAKRYGVDRLDPYSSIMGGARYLLELKRDGLHARIQEPDKTWLALAAYNIGLGHVENARILTQRGKKNPDMWPDVRRHLPLLANPEVASQFKLGPCRCGMPVEYVEAVRAYYDVLLRLEPPHQPRLRIQ
ncbi:MAG: membrane-bound lytic murein transglycosylase MltF [Betaproteobacteria bacterium]|nr:MAG: membrane-bound lytic murein transglycosylase MltF [Betaproteobacteria bacterium]